jgi:aminoglycoside phosphotransferase (APT) family kinase protein
MSRRLAAPAENSTRAVGERPCDTCVPRYSLPIVFIMHREHLIDRTIETLRGRWPEVGVAALAAFTGGASSLTYLATLTDAPVDRVVVKVAPPGLAPVRNRDVLRQADVLERLAKHRNVRVPVVYGRHAGDPPEIPPLFVMSFEPGDSDEPLHIPADLAPTVVDARARQAARMLAALHLVDVHDIIGPTVSSREEVNNWVRALESVPAKYQAGAANVSARLLRQLPGTGPASLSHGDWRLGNTLCIGGDVRSVIDWEIWSVSDGRLDLAWYLMMCDPAHPSAIAGAESGMPPVADLLIEYEQVLGRRVKDLGWYRALAAYKQAAITALIAKNSAKRGVPMEGVTARISHLLPELLAWADSFLDAGAARFTTGPRSAASRERR